MAAFRALARRHSAPLVPAPGARARPVAAAVAAVILAGADPGADGAVALIDAETGRILALVDMPMSGTELRVRELLLDLTAALDGRRLGHLWIERQAPYAGEGRRIGGSSAFALGQRFMALKAIAACSGWPFEIVTAARWKGHFGIKADKSLALDCAGRLLPLDAERWAVRRGVCTRAAAIGRAEAALIALYGLRSIGAIAAGEAA